MNESNGYIRKEVGPNVVCLFDMGLAVMLDRETFEYVGSWPHPATDAPAFVRKAFCIKYVHPSQELEFQHMRIVDWFHRGQTVGA